MKTPKYHLYLTTEERSEVLKSLIDLKNNLNYPTVLHKTFFIANIPCDIFRESVDETFLIENEPIRRGESAVKNKVLVLRQ